MAFGGSRANFANFSFWQSVVLGGAAAIGRPFFCRFWLGSYFCRKYLDPTEHPLHGTTCGLSNLFYNY